jgi:hypothetical protein
VTDVSLCHTRRTMHKILVRAIITGFGMRLGGELAKFIIDKAFPSEKQAEDDGEPSDDEQQPPPGEITPDPPEL